MIRADPACFSSSQKSRLPTPWINGKIQLFGEYSLLFAIDEPDFTIDLGLGNTAVGIIIYLN